MMVAAAALLVAFLGIFSGFVLASADDRGAAEAILTSVEKDPDTKGVTAEPVRRSRDALERGRRMRSAGDETHAKLADGLALEWARVAQDLQKTVQTERRARDLAARSADAGTQVDRERTQLEQRLAENGLLAAEATRLDDAGAARDAAPQATAMKDGGAP
ncbi:hypothetical protein BH09MYX1_BH09MYX1_53580 [soil metagenome]